LIGLDTIAAAQEVVAVAVEALEAAGVTGISIDFTLPDLLATLAAGPLPLGDVSLDELADRLDAKDAGAVAALAPSYLPMIEAAGPFETAHDRLCRFDVGGALRSRLDGLWKVAEAVKGRVALTLDPTERHGFEYQTWLGFSLFADGARGEIGRGGSYTIVHEDRSEETAIGFTLYIDAIVAAGLAHDERRRLFVPLGSDPALAAKLRGEGWVTVAALEAGDTPEAQLCTHVLTDGEVRTLTT
jgi:ATP phosphoribosyltransferase regulatory subunit